MKSRLGAGLAAAILAAACQATPIYNQYYHQNTEEVNRPARAAAVMGIEPSGLPLGGRLKVVIPSDKSIVEKVLGPMEREQFERMDATNRAAATAGAVGQYTANYRFMADVLKKAALFDEVAVERADFGQEPDLGGFDYVHWFTAKDAGPDSFWIKGRNGAARAVPFRFASNAASPAQTIKDIGNQYRETMEGAFRALAGAKG
ncbi:MAG: hypothetical protein H7841_07440 [Magnetospirillum sp. WYHS-4]